MNWDMWATIAEVLAAIGVIASLIYVARQVQDSASQTKLMAIQSVLSKITATTERIAGDPSLADIWVRGIRGLSELQTEGERLRFLGVLLSLFRTYEEMFHYHGQGAVEDWAWSGLNATFQDITAAQGVQEWWQLRHAWFSSEFAAFVSDSMREPDSVVVEAYAQRPDDS